MNRRVRMGVVGLGRVGAFHAANLAGRVPGAELVCVVDADESVARKVSEHLARVDWSTDYSKLLDDPEIEGIVIATSTPTHVELIERAAAAGKHVFCEKPLSLDLKSSREVTKAAQAAGIKLQVGFHRRFDPDHRIAYEKISAGEVGDVYFFRATFRDAKPPDPRFLSTSGGLFVDVTLHDFDAARWLVGEIEEVTAKGAALSDPGFAEIGDIDNGAVLVRFANGALGVIDTSRASGYGCECSCEVMGSEATLRIGPDSAHQRITLQTLTYETLRQNYVMNFMERFDGAFVAEMEAFAQAMLEDEEPVVTGADATAAYVLSQAAMRSYREGRTIRLEQEPEPHGVTYREVVG